MVAYAEIERRSAPPFPLKKPTPVCHANHRLSLLLVLACVERTLLLDTRLPPCASSLDLLALGLHLFGDGPLAGLLGLGLVNLGQC